MCTTPQNVYVPRAGVDTDEGHLSFDEFGEKLAAAIGRLTGDDAKAVELLGATVNDGVRERAAGLADARVVRRWPGRGRLARRSRTRATPTPSSGRRVWSPST